MSHGKTSQDLQMSVILWLSYHFHRYYDLGFSICHDLLIIVTKTSMTNSLQSVSLLVVIDFKWMVVQLLLACSATLQSILVEWVAHCSKSQKFEPQGWARSSWVHLLRKECIVHRERPYDLWFALVFVFSFAIAFLSATSVPCPWHSDQISVR